MKYQIIILLSCATSLMACKTLQQKWRSQFNAQQTLSMEQLKQQQLEQGLQMRIVDSAFIGYQVLIMPKGKFSYSPAKGFEGEADTLLIKGMATKTTKIDEVKRMVTQITEHTTIQEKQKISTKELAKEKEKTGNWKLVLIGLIVVIAGTYCLYRLVRSSI